MKNSDSQDPKEKMLETFLTVWKHAKSTERCYIQSIWSTIMEPAHVLSWKLAENPHQYHLEIKEEVVGRHPDISMGELVLEKKMTIVFSENKISETERYRQIIQFPEKGISIRIGMGWLSKNNPLQSIFFEENQEGKIWCTVEVFGQSIARSAEEAVDFWKKIQWHA